MKHTLKTLIPTLLVAFACAGSTHAQRFLSYEPDVVELDGRLVIQSKYGPPNFGQKPKTDQKVQVPILLLSQHVVVQGDVGDDKQPQTAHNVRQIQLAFAGNETSHKELIGKPVVVTGTLFRAHTGHHYTEVVLNVQSIESKPAGYQFVVCQILTSEWYLKQRYGTSNFNHAEFRALVGEDEIQRSFKHAKSGLIINAGVQFEYDIFAKRKKSPRPDEIRIALSASNKEEDALHASSDNAVAGTVYSRNWGNLYVTKRVVVGDIEHTFTLHCYDPNVKSLDDLR